jgi:hypothetical protein
MEVAGRTNDGRKWIPWAAPTLLGRADELALLSGLLDQGCNRRGGALVIHGDAGLGKSALLAWLHRAADLAQER